LSVVATDGSRLGAIRRDELAHAARVAIASMLSWWLAVEAGFSSAPYLASVACLMYMQPSVYESFTRAIQRMVAVVLGVGLAVALFTVAGVNAWIVGLVILVGLLAATALRLGPGGSIQIALSGLLVLAVTSIDPGYPGQRILETMLGAGVGLLVMLIASPPAVSPAERAAAAVVSQASLVLRTLGEVLADGWSSRSAESVAQSARVLRDLADDARIKVDRATESLRLNPRARSARPTLERARMKVDALHPVSRRAVTTINVMNEDTEETAPMPNLARLLTESAQVIEAYGGWCDAPTDPEAGTRLRRDLVAADEAWSNAAAIVERRWRERPERWLRFGMLLPLCGLVSTEARGGLESGAPSVRRR
jgi:Aromatic acid exporter family member 1